VTEEYGESKEQIKQTLEAVKRLNEQAIIIFPNCDAGNKDIERCVIACKLDILRYLKVYNEKIILEY